MNGRDLLTGIPKQVYTDHTEISSALDKSIQKIEEAILKALDPEAELEHIIFELEQAPDERFKLKHIISSDSFSAKARHILERISPLITESDADDETLFSNQRVIEEIEQITDDFLQEIEKKLEHRLK